MKKTKQKLLKENYKNVLKGIELLEREKRTLVFEMENLGMVVG